MALDSAVITILAELEETTTALGSSSPITLFAEIEETTTALGDSAPITLISESLEITAMGATFTHTRDLTEIPEYPGATYSYTRDVGLLYRPGATYSHTRGAPFVGELDLGIRGPQLASRTVGLDRFLQTPLSALTVFNTVDLTAAASTTVYTVPSQNNAIIFGCLLRVTLSEDVTGDASVSVGSVGTDDLFPAEALTQIRSPEDLWAFWTDKTSTMIVQGGNSVNVTVTNAATATLLGAQVYIIGILI